MKKENAHTVSPSISPKVLIRMLCVVQNAGHTSIYGRCLLQQATLPTFVHNVKNTGGHLFLTAFFFSATTVWVLMTIINSNIEASGAILVYNKQPSTGSLTRCCHGNNGDVIMSRHPADIEPPLRVAPPPHRLTAAMSTRQTTVLGFGSVI